MAIVDLHPRTLQPVSGYERIVEAIKTIVYTGKRTELIRRYFGVEIDESIDRQMKEARIVALLADIADQVDREEPEFLVTHVMPERLDASGVFEFVIKGYDLTTLQPVVIRAGG